MWISSDEIDVRAEEDAFKVILAWVDHDRSKRKKYFEELLRQVRPIYVTPDYLRWDVVTNYLVTDNDGSLDLVVDAINLIDSRNYRDLSVKKVPLKLLSL